jgi:hypothetical protein
VTFNVHDGKGNVLPYIGWNLGRWADQMPPVLDIVYRIEPDTWREQDRLRLNLVGLKAHSDEDGS